LSSFPIASLPLLKLSAETTEDDDYKKRAALAPSRFSWLAARASLDSSCATHGGSGGSLAFSKTSYFFPTIFCAVSSVIQHRKACGGRCAVFGNLHPFPLVTLNSAHQLRGIYLSLRPHSCKAACYSCCSGGCSYAATRRIVSPPFHVNCKLLQYVAISKAPLSKPISSGRYRFRMMDRSAALQSHSAGRDLQAMHGECQVAGRSCVRPTTGAAWDPSPKQASGPAGSDRPTSGRHLWCGSRGHARRKCTR